MNLKRYTIKATHIVAKSYPVLYPITFNLSALTPYGERILIADRINSTDFENGNYAYFPLKKPTNIVSTKLQMTGRRMTKVGKHYNDWALEIFFFDIFGTLYNGTYTEKLSSPKLLMILMNPSFLQLYLWIVFNNLNKDSFSTLKLSIFKSLSHI